MFQIIEAANTIAKHTSAIANMCRDASSRSQNPAAKKQFINCARDVASATAEVIKAIKVLDADFTDSNRQQCARQVDPLLEALNQLVQFANGPEFASIPARISAQVQ